jgi:autoinducer 2-degrading protein
MPWNARLVLAIVLGTLPRAPTLDNCMNDHPLYIVHVHVRVKPERMEAFKAATIENARNSIQEPGVARFDVIQEHEDPTRFVLVEIYRNPEAAAAHKATGHYAAWRDAVADMMAEPRNGIKYTNIFPDAANWE